MNKLSLWTLAGFGALCLAGHSFAAEVTGRTLEKLVADVDKNLTSLEDLTSRHAPAKEQWNTRLQDLEARYAETEGPSLRLALRGEIVDAMARLNRADRAEVTATLEAVVNISETMRTLRTTLQQANDSGPEKLPAQKAQMTHFVKNAAKIIRAIEAAGGGKAETARSASLKNSLSMLYQQLHDPHAGMGAALERVNEAVTTLDAVAVQLKIVLQNLEQEKATLVIASHNQLLELIQSRFARTRPGAASVTELAAVINEGVAARLKNSNPALREIGQIGFGLSYPDPRLDHELLLLDDVD